MNVQEEYKKWREDKVWCDYESKHPLFEELLDVVSEVMYVDGPDRHTDGSNLIAAFILEHYNITPIIVCGEES